MRLNSIGDTMCKVDNNANAKPLYTTAQPPSAPPVPNGSPANAANAVAPDISDNAWSCEQSGSYESDMGGSLHLPNEAGPPDACHANGANGINGINGANAM